MIKIIKLFRHKRRIKIKIKKIIKISKNKIMINNFKIYQNNNKINSFHLKTKPSNNSNKN